MGIGVTSKHAVAIADVAAKKNFFLFIRPTTDDSLALIELGFATKSMDIHSKSSDWGPMAGFVPCDPGLCKKPMGAKPNPDFKPHSDPHHPHALSTHLTYTDNVYNTLKAGLKNYPGRDLEVWSDGVVMRVKGFASHTNSSSAKVTTRRHVLTGDSIRLVEPVKKTQDLVFALTRDTGRWKVWWVHFDPGKLQGRLVPVLVWAYLVKGQPTPVTGDYDMWMVAPHLSAINPEDHATIIDTKDDHGESSASRYTLDLIKKLNEACQRADNPVFNHGAEAQNRGFTQAHDKELLMFTPSGKYRTVTIDRVPQILADMQRAGYLVINNKQWAEQNPDLMGMKAPAKLRWKLLKEGLGTAVVKTLEERGEEAPEKWKRKANDLGRQVLQLGIKESIQKSMKFDGSVAAKEGRRYIVHWYKQLDEALAAAAEGPKELKVDEFPGGYHMASEEARQLQNSLEQVAMQHVHGAGANDSETWQSWLKEHAGALKRLQSYWT